MFLETKAGEYPYLRAEQCILFKRENVRTSLGQGLCVQAKSMTWIHLKIITESNHWDMNAFVCCWWSKLRLLSWKTKLYISYLKI